MKKTKDDIGTTLREEISFIDAEKNLFKLKIEIKNGELSISGECGNSFGQCYDSIKPANPEQARIVEIWKTYHLNGMHAGTEKQEKILKGFYGDYDDKVKLLKKHRAYSDGGYIYGSKWLKRELPATLHKEITELCARIRVQGNERKTSLGGGSWSEDTSDEIKALAAVLGLAPKEAEKDIWQDDDNSDYYFYLGVRYLVGDEETIERYCRECLDKSMWIECIKSDQTEESFGEWQDTVINGDGYGSILNHYDGSEDGAEIDGIYYYVIRD